MKHKNQGPIKRKVNVTTGESEAEQIPERHHAPPPFKLFTEGGDNNSGGDAGNGMLNPLSREAATPLPGGNMNVARRPSKEEDEEELEGLGF